MKLIAQDEYEKLIDYLPFVKEEVAEWQLVNIHVTDTEMEDLQGTSVTEILLIMFERHDGRLYICGPNDLIAIIRWPSKQGQLALSRTLERGLPADSCEIFVHAPDADGLKKLELRLTAPKPEAAGIEIDANCVLIADDDLYMRSLIKKGLADFNAHEVIDGKDVLRAYKHYAPAIVFLDVHLPNREGPEILEDIIAYHPDAYVIMLSADSSRENVLHATRLGAKGFLAKPFTKEKLLELVRKCPGIEKSDGTNLSQVG